MRLSVRGPRGAVVLIDGKDSGRVPLDLELARSDGKRAVTVKLDGRAPFTTSVRGDANETVTVPARKATPRQPGEPELRDPFAP